MQSRMFRDVEEVVVQPQIIVTCLGCKAEEKSNKLYMFNSAEFVCDSCLKKLWDRVGKYFIAGGGLEGNAPTKTAITCMHRRSATINDIDKKLYCDDCLTEIEFNEND